MRAIAMVHKTVPQRVQILSLLVLALVLPQYLHAQTIKTDQGVYPEPPLPSLPQAGSKVIDPTFGTTILRLTDGTDGNTSAGSMYSYWSAFNKDNSYVVVREQRAYPQAKFFAFNPTTFTADIANGFFLTYPNTGEFNAYTLQEQSLLWSGATSNIFYAIQRRELWKVTIVSRTSQTYSKLREFSDVLPAGWIVTQPSKSLNDDIFAMSITDAAYNVKGYLVWKRSTNQILRSTISVVGVDEVHVDKSGRWLIIDFTTGNNEIWDLSTTPPTKSPNCCTWGITGFFHYGLGQGTALTGLEPRQLGFRSLSNPSSILSLLPDPLWTMLNRSDHLSMLADNEQWGLGSRYRIDGGPVDRPFDNEILRVATDGSQRVRRFAHHRSVIINNAYPPQPKAAISRDGRFVLFTSNWGNSSGRTDAYIVHTLPAGLVAAYGMDEGANGTTVDRVANTPATLVNAAWTTQGKYGAGLVFNGASAYAVVPAPATALQFSTDFTIEAWVKPTMLPNTWTTIVSRQYGTGSKASWWMGTFGSVVELYMDFPGGASALVATSLVTGQWQHVAVVKQGTVLRIYMNGVLRASSTTPSSSMLNDPNEVTVGASVNGSAIDSYFNGTVDEVRLYNRALTAAQIQADRDTPILDY